MKKLIKAISICVVVLSFFTACGKETEDLGDKYVEGKDSQYMFCGNSKGKAIASTEKGYYFLNGSYIFFADRETMKTTVLCNKPNCKHIDQEDPSKVYDCNAFVDYNMGFQFIEYYNGKLYTMSYFDAVEKKKERSLIEISLDGSERKKIMKIVNPESMLMHRGYVYHTENVEGGKKALVRTNIEHPDKGSEEIYRGTFKSSDIRVQYAYGNHIFFKQYGDDNEQKKYVEQQYEYNILTKKATRILTEDKKLAKDELSPQLMGLKDDKLYYTIRGGDMHEKVKNKFYRCNLDGSNAEVYKDFEQQEDYVHLSVDDKYSYQIDYDWDYEDKETLEEELKKCQFVVFDKDLKEIARTQNTGLPRMYEINTGDDRYMFITYMDRDNDIVYFFYLDKNEIKNGKIELKKLIESPTDKVIPGVSW